MKNTAEIREALKLINKGVSNLIDLLDGNDAVDIKDTVQPKTRGNSVSTPVEKPEPVKAEVTESEPNSIDLENIEEYSYNELKKIAKELNLSAKGTKPELVERIKQAQSTAIPVEPDTSASPAEEEVVDNNNGSDLVTKVNEAVADMSDEELADLLVSCGISASGKRKALIDKVVTAVKDGIIDFDDEEVEDLPEPEDVKEVPAPALPDEDIEETEDEEGEFEFESPSGVNDLKRKDMTSERSKAIVEFVEQTIEGINDEKITEKLMKDYLVSYGYDKKEINKLSFIALVNYYIDTAAMFIDDDGNHCPTEEPYMVNDVPYCCGYKLIKADNTFICETCGAEYEADDE